MRSYVGKLDVKRGVESRSDLVTSVTVTVSVSADVSLGLGQLQLRQVLEAHLFQHGQSVRVHFDGVSVIDYGDLVVRAMVCGRKEEKRMIRISSQYKHIKIKAAV